MITRGAVDLSQWKPQDVSNLHNKSDVDSSQLAQHHTLGSSSNQAAPGNHKHNSKDVLNLVVPPSTNFTSASTLTRRGDVVELYFSATSIAAAGGGAGMIVIPSAHEAVSTQPKYFEAFDVATGAARAIYLYINSVYLIFGIGAGVGTIGHITYLAKS